MTYCVIFCVHLIFQFFPTKSSYCTARKAKRGSKTWMTWTRCRRPRCHALHASKGPLRRPGPRHFWSPSYWSLGQVLEVQRWHFFNSLKSRMSESTAGVFSWNKLVIVIHRDGWFEGQLHVSLRDDSPDMARNDQVSWKHRSLVMPRTDSPQKMVGDTCWGKCVQLDCMFSCTLDYSVASRELLQHQKCWNQKVSSNLQWGFTMGFRPWMFKKETSNNTPCFPRVNDPCMMHTHHLSALAFGCFCWGRSTRIGPNINCEKSPIQLALTRLRAYIVHHMCCLFVSFICWVFLPFHV